MPRLHYAKAVNGPVLYEELLAAIPALAPSPGPNGELQMVLLLEYTATDCWLTVPEDTDVATVDAVVAAHDPAVPPPRTLEERRQAKAAFAAERQIASSP